MKASELSVYVGGHSRLNHHLTSSHTMRYLTKGIFVRGRNTDLAWVRWKALRWCAASDHRQPTKK
jgi:hypothetical protein